MFKRKSIKRIFAFVFALVMFASPVLFAGCSLFDFGTTEPIPTQNTNNPSGSGGTGGGTGGGSTTPTTPTSNIYDPPKSDELSPEDYDDYFENYRITYVPGSDASKESFNNSLSTDVKSISNNILDLLMNIYGDSTDNGTVKNLFYNSIRSILDEDSNYLVAKINDNYYIAKTGDFNDRHFSYYNTINDCEDSSNDNLVVWNWNTYAIETNDEKLITAENFVSQNNKNRLQLASYLILSGYELSENGTGNFVEKYKSYFKDNNLTEIKDEYISGNELNLDSLNDIISNIDNLGLTELQQESLRNFVLNYIIGSENVAQDNKRFVNAYANKDGELKILYTANDSNAVNILQNNSNIKNASQIKNGNRFLTDVTYATGDFYDGGFQFKIATPSESDQTVLDENKNLTGLLNYAGEYLKTASANTFGEFLLNGYTSSIGTDAALNNETVTENVDVTNAVYDNLINIAGSKLKVDSNGNAILDGSGNLQYDFNANVWGETDSDGNALDSVLVKVDELNPSTNTMEENTYSAFSIRLPYFKNYYNTISFMIEDMFGKLTAQRKAELDTQWNDEKGIDYPYDTEYPTVPYSYFCDYDNSDMLFDNKTVTHMFSGFQAYQNIVLMPKKVVYLKSGAFFIIREPILNEQPNDGSGDFDLTIYARYYDAESKTYATWGDDNSEFYLIDTIKVKYDIIRDSKGNFQDYAPSAIDFDARAMLTTARINGQERNSYLLDPFAEDTKILTHENVLISKNNYGYWFKKASTPLGDSVVCFDGKSADSQSYIEFVFANPEKRSFQFCFYPTVCYKDALGA